MKVYCPDINVLIACARQDHPNHASAKKWLSSAAQQVADGACSISLPMVVIAGFVRIVTHAKIMIPPNTPSEALAYIDALLDVLQTKVLDHPSWQAFKTLVQTQSLAGNDVPDAWLASHAIVAGGVVVTFDKGFKKLLPKSQVLVLSPS